MRRFTAIVVAALIAAATCPPAGAETPPFTMTFTGTLSVLCERNFGLGVLPSFDCPRYDGYRYGFVDGSVVLSGDTEPRAFHADLVWFVCAQQGIDVALDAVGTFDTASGPEQVDVLLTSMVASTSLVMAGNVQAGGHSGLVSGATTFGLRGPDDEPAAAMCFGPGSGLYGPGVSPVTAPLTFTAAVPL